MTNKNGHSNERYTVDCKHNADAENRKKEGWLTQEKK